MIGLIQRDEALGVSCQAEKLGGIFDADNAVSRRMTNEQGPVEILYGFLHPCLLQVFQKLLPDPELLPGQVDFHLAGRGCRSR